MSRELFLSQLRSKGKKGREAFCNLLKQDILGSTENCAEGILPAFVEMSASSEAEIKLSLGTKRLLVVNLSISQMLDSVAVPKVGALGALALQKCMATEFHEHQVNIHKSREPLPEPRSIAALSEGTFISNQAGSLKKRLVDGVSVRLIGSSASGKTVLAAQVATSLIQNGWTVTWVDLSNPTFDSFDLILNLTRRVASTPRGHLIVIDDAQANPGELVRISKVISLLRNEVGVPITLLVLGWPSAERLLQEAFPHSALMQCFGDSSLPFIARSFFSDNVDQSVIDDLRRHSGGDLVLVTLLLKRYKELGRFPALDELAKLTFKKITQGEDIDHQVVITLYRVASLSQFEIDTSISYLDVVGADVCKRLIKRQILRVNGNYCTLGHRSLARLVILYLRENEKSRLISEPTPEAIAVEYLKLTEPQQILSTLERLDLTSLANQEGDQHGTTFLAKAWESLLILMNYIAGQATTDATWDDNTASSAFAAQALAELGNDNWFQISAHLRSRWNIDSDYPTPWPKERERPSERVDFDEIVKSMVELEEAGQSFPSDQLSSNVDLDKMHRTWVLGLLLGFEGNARVLDVHRLRRLREIATKIQLPSGAFYPERVPWVTARVLIGLASAGESIQSSPVVRNACAWLKKPHPLGPNRLGTWESGTGRWNSTLGTTCMCVNALVSCGVPATDPYVKMGISYLIDKREEWIRGGQEIDAAFALETLLKVGKRWREFSGELNFLLAWVRDREPWANALRLASDSKDESCKVSQVASSLIQIVWATVRSELPLLLEGISNAMQEAPVGNVEKAVPSSAIVGSIQEIRAELESKIKERKRVLSRIGTEEDPTKIRAVLSELHAQMEEIEKIEIRIQELDSSRSPSWDSYSEIVQAVNLLGAAIFRAGWHELKDNL